MWWKVKVLVFITYTQFDTLGNDVQYLSFFYGHTNGSGTQKDVVTREQGSQGGKGSN
jgi:hypothetical protein